MATFLLTWNPEVWPDDFAEVAQAASENSPVPGQWSSGNTKRIQKGDRLFLLKQGKPPRGIVAAGHATGPVESGEHFTEERAAQGDHALYVPLAWDSAVDAKRVSPLLVDQLDGPLEAVNWATPASGISIPDDAAQALEHLWRQHLRKVQPPPFVVEGQYTRPDICRILGVPKAQSGGDWNTGYHQHDGQWYIFTTIGGPGRTGHNYGNHWIGNDLYWRGKTRSSTNSPQIKAMTADDSVVHVFTREKDRDPFRYEGVASPKEIRNTVPVTVIWEFGQRSTRRVEAGPEEVPASSRYIEGATRLVRVNVYERNPAARRACIAKHGTRCAVCQFDFKKRYGSLGEGFIHVHHLRDLASIGEEYEVDPVNDLRPVCPNCHAMLHRKDPPIAIDDLRDQLR